MRLNNRVGIPKDLILFSLLLLLSLFVLVLATRMPPSPHEPLGPGSMPMILAIGLGSISLIRILKLSLDWYVKARESATQPTEEPPTGPIQGSGEKSDTAQALDPMIPHPLLAAGAIVGLCLMVSLLQFRWLGFRIIAFFYVLTLSFFLQRREKRLSRLSFWIIAVIVSVVMSFGVYWLFTTIFNVRLR